MNILELYTALRAARYQLSRTRAGSAQRTALADCISQYTLQIVVLEKEKAA